MDKTTQQIADRLKAVRTEKGLTQNEVALKAELNPNYYAKVERGEAAATVKTLEKIIKALGAKSSDIMPF